ncbi:uncharacterized protein [Glycine max]|uniref:uncharacterized protein n=1 Tax=Glycine max TaxID=3847 RepID=UPI001B354756|nr:uncharacterized protein LOC100783311 [Glycine max]
MESSSEQRLQSLERCIEEKEKKLVSIKRQFGREIDAKEREYDVVTRKVEERNRELESVQRRITDCEWKLDTVRRMITESDEVYQQKQRGIQDSDRELAEKEAHRSLIADMIREREQELRAKDAEFQQVLDEGMALKNKVAQLNDDLKTKKEELDVVTRSLINEQATETTIKSMRARIKQLLRQPYESESKQKQFEGQAKELESKQKHYERQVKELQSKQKQYEGRVKELKLNEKLYERKVRELGSREKQYETRMKELESNEKQCETRMKEVESNAKQYEKRVKELVSHERQYVKSVIELNSKEKQIEGQMVDLESKKNQYEGLVKELESKEARCKVLLKELESIEKKIQEQMKDLEFKKNQCESSRKSFEEEKLSKQKSNDQQHFTNANSASLFNQQNFTGADNSKNLPLFINLLEKYELMCSQVSDALQTFANPTKLVLDTIKGFYTSHSRQGLIEYDASISRRICNLLMDELKKSSPVIGIRVKQEAIKLATDWKANLVAGDKDCLEVLDFFKFVATYEIGSSFDAIELQRLLDIIALQYQTLQAIGKIKEPSGNNYPTPSRYNYPTISNSLYFVETIFTSTVSFTLYNQSSPTIDGRNLHFPSIKHINESVNLHTSSDPAKLVLDIILVPIASEKQGSEGAIIIDESHILLLEQLMRISPRVKPRVREEALKIAFALKANIRESAENSLTILGFLLLLSAYGLVSYFRKDELFKQLESAAQHKQAVELFRTLGFVDKIFDFVRNLIMKQQHIEAVRFICAYKLADKIQPVDLLRQHVAKVKSVTNRFACMKESVEQKIKVRDEEIVGLRTVLECISENNLESHQDLVKEINDRIVDLEKQKENVVRLTSGPSSEVEEKTCGGEAVTVTVHKPEEKKRHVGFVFPENYFRPANPMAWSGNNGTNYYGNSRPPYPPFG